VETLEREFNLFKRLKTLRAGYVPHTLSHVCIRVPQQRNLFSPPPTHCALVFAACRHNVIAVFDETVSTLRDLELVDYNHNEVHHLTLPPPTLHHHSLPIASPPLNCTPPHPTGTVHVQIGRIPDGLHCCVKITHLDMSYNGVTRVTDALHTLGALTHLDLSHNRCASRALQRGRCCHHVYTLSSAPPPPRVPSRLSRLSPTIFPLPMMHNSIQSHQPHDLDSFNKTCLGLAAITYLDISHNGIEKVTIFIAVPLRLSPRPR